MEELRDLYVEKLTKALAMEHTILEHLPKMIEAATNETLREGLRTHLDETRTHIARVEAALAGRKSGNIAGRDDAFRMMVETAGKDIEKIEDSATRDALIIASAQAVEHHEIAKYGTLIEWAKTLDEEGETINALKANLNEEEAADKKLSSVAEGGIFSTGVNQMAAK
jgi:ferritin-like metal-binding protein YciE